MLNTLASNLNVKSHREATDWGWGVGCILYIKNSMIKGLEADRGGEELDAYEELRYFCVRGQVTQGMLTTVDHCKRSGFYCFVHRKAIEGF